MMNKSVLSEEDLGAVTGGVMNITELRSNLDAAFLSRNEQEAISAMKLLSAAQALSQLDRNNFSMIFGHAWTASQYYNA